MSFSLRLFGGVALAGPAGPVTGPAAQRHRLALLALLAAARPRAVSRDKLLAWLWPERESESARRLLNQAVHAVRQALGADAILSAGDDLQLDPGAVECDIVAFEEALAGGTPERAVDLYRGPFLDGFFLDEAPEFERWVDRERDRLAAAYGKALEGLAASAERAGEWGTAVERWRSRAAHDPYDSRIALRLMQALERAGNRAGALQHAVQHQQLLRTELEIEPPPEIHALVEQLRRESAPVERPRSDGGKRERQSDLPPAQSAAGEPAAGQSLAEPSRAPLHAPVLREAPRTRVLWYAVAAVVVVVAAGGAIRLAARSGHTAAVPVTSPDVDQIAKAVARELASRQRGDTVGLQPQQRTRSLAAYEAFLRGSDPAVLRSDSGARRGLEHFRRAVSLDSTYAAAWVGLARLTVRVSGDSAADRRRARTEAEGYIRRALALDDSLAEAHAVLAMLRVDISANESDQAFRRAIELDPRRGRLRELYVMFLMGVGRSADALPQAERAVELDPLSPSAIAELARALAANGRCKEALVRLETIRSLDPPLLRAAPIAAGCHAREGRWDEAIAVLRPQVDRGDSGSLAMIGYLQGRAGRPAEARSIQARMLELRNRGKVSAEVLAFVPSGLGNRDEAFAWLDSAAAEGSLTFVPGSRTPLVDFVYDPLRGDPRMSRLRKALGIQNR